jgi:hypothetical protein
MAMTPQDLKSKIRGPVHLTMTPFDENEDIEIARIPLSELKMLK